MQRLEVSGAVRPIYGSLGVKRLILFSHQYSKWSFPTRFAIKKTVDLCPPSNFSFIIYSKTCLKRNAIVPVFFSVFTGFRFTKGCVLIKRSTKNMIA